MRINETSPELLRPEALKNSRVAGADVAPAQPASPAGRSDKVSISDAGRALAARGEESQLTPERTAEIRQRILDGTYNSLDAVEEVARRILARGDV